MRGCLVLLGPFRGKRDYKAKDGTPAVVRDEQNLRYMLRAEVREDGPVGRELARARLGAGWHRPVESARPSCGGGAQVGIDTLRRSCDEGQT